ncbi:MAG: hypothetical protein QOD83_3205 [Solirubrobacteraceae bacterium]|jgi:hypothetical protein|nr:hypothetical protein [Solirubrobacteraceae bacterium]
MPPPSYRERLRLEGAVLAGAGAVASAVLLAGVDEASNRSGSTVIQIAAVVVLIALLGPLAVRRWMAGAQPVAEGAELTGEPTALWWPVLVLVVLVAIFVVPGELGLRAAGWDAGLRITLGCLVVGLAQAVLLERLVAADEARTGRRYVRLPGSRALGGTKLGFFSHKRV